MEDARQACGVGVKWEIGVADSYGKCAHVKPFCYAILCCDLYGAIPELCFLSRPHQPNEHNNQVTLVNPP